MRPSIQERRCGGRLGARPIAGVTARNKLCLRLVTAISSLLLLLPLWSCRKGDPKGKDSEPAAAAAPPSSPPQFTPCARLSGRGTRSLSPDGGATLPALGSLRLEPAGHFVLRAVGPERPAAERSRLVLAVLGDTREALPETLAGLERLTGEARRAGAAAAIVLGGIDSTYEGIHSVLRQLAVGRLPVLALPGDRESQSGFQAAVANAGPSLVDLTAVRALVLPAATLISLPGYHLPHHLLAGKQGCGYDASDLDALARFAASLPQPRVLLAHGPPLGDGPDGIDRAFGGVNIGDAGMARLMKSARIRFGLFAHVHEAGGRAITVEGRPVPENKWSDSLLLNVGAADTVPHEDLDGRWSRGSAALVELEEGRARYRMLPIAGEPGAGTSVP